MSRARATAWYVWPYCGPGKVHDHVASCGLPRQGARPQIWVVTQVAVFGSHHSPVSLSRSEISTVDRPRLSPAAPLNTTGASVELPWVGEVSVSVGRLNSYVGRVELGSNTEIRSFAESAT